MRWQVRFPPPLGFKAWLPTSHSDAQPNAWVPLSWVLWHIEDIIKYHDYHEQRLIGFRSWISCSVTYIFILQGMLQELSQPQKRVKACDIDQLKQAVQADLYWVRSFNCQTFVRGICSFLQIWILDSAGARGFEVGWKTRKIEWWRRHRGPTGQGQARYPIGGLLLERVPRSDGSSPTAGFVLFRSQADISCISMPFFHFLLKKTVRMWGKCNMLLTFLTFRTRTFHTHRDGLFVCSCQEDATLQVRFPSVSLTAWLPESTLTYIEEREPEAGHDSWHENDVRMNEMESQSRTALIEKTFGSNFVECPPYHAEVETEHIAVPLLMMTWFVATCKLSASEAAAVEKSESS